MRTAALLASALLLLLWWRAKVVLFEAFSYTSDLFSFVQMSRTWLEGRPLLYENAFGYHARLHGFYSVALLGPLTRFLGAHSRAALALGGRRPHRPALVARTYVLTLPETFIIR